MHLKYTEHNIKKIIKYIFLVCIFIPPGIVSSWPVLNTLTTVLAVMRLSVSLFVISAVILAFLRSGRLQVLVIKYWLFLLLLFLWIVISDLVNKTDISTIGGIIRPLINIIGYAIIIEKAFKNDEQDFFLAGTSFYCIIVCTINYITQIYLPNGIYKNDLNWQPYHFCGNGNSFVFFYLFSICITTLFGLSKHKLPKYIFAFYFLLFASMMIANSDTGYVTIMIVSILMIILLKFNGIASFIRKRYRFFISVAAVFVIWFLIFQGWNNDLVLNFMEGFFGHTLHSYLVRGDIWNSVVNKILERPFIGYGNDINADSVIVGGIRRSAHNCFLQLALVGGITALLFFICLIFSSFRGIKTIKNKNYLCCLMILSGYLLSFLFEQRPYSIELYMVILLSHIFINQNLKEYKL